jgi:hypothetical protein
MRARHEPTGENAANYCPGDNLRYEQTQKEQRLCLKMQSVQDASKYRGRNQSSCKVFQEIRKHRDTRAKARDSLSQDHDDSRRRADNEPVANAHLTFCRHPHPSRRVVLCIQSAPRLIIAHQASTARE